jgi:hypothetical protein
MLEVGASKQRLLIAGNIKKALHASFFPCLPFGLIHLLLENKGE